MGQDGFRWHGGKCARHNEPLVDNEDLGAHLGHGDPGRWVAGGPDGITSAQRTKYNPCLSREDRDANQSDGGHARGSGTVYACDNQGASTADAYAPDKHGAERKSETAPARVTGATSITNSRGGNAAHQRRGGRCVNSGTTTVSDEVGASSKVFYDFDNRGAGNGSENSPWQRRQARSCALNAERRWRAPA